MRLAVIIPTLNEEKTIGRLFHSIAHNTIEPDEIILVDGGSSDETLREAITEFYSSDFFQCKFYMYQRENEICPESQNFGARIAEENSILLFLGSDVILGEKCLEQIKNKFEKDSSLTALTGIPITFNASLTCKLEYLLYYSFAGIFNLARLRFIANNTFFAIRRERFLELGGFPSIENPDCVFATTIPIKETRFFNDLRYFVDGRRYKKFGFFGFNRYYNFCLENFFPVFSKVVIREKDSPDKVKSRHLYSDYR